MAEFLTFDTDLTAVANAIRAKGGTSAQLVYPNGFVSAIQAIQTGITPKLVVTTSAGAAVTAVKGSKTVTGTAGTDGVCTLELPEAGAWSVTSAKNGVNAAQSIVIGTQSMKMPLYLDSFADNTWEEIIAVCRTGIAPDSWAVGDSKTMNIGGTAYQVDIIGKNHDEYADGSGTAPLTFQLHDCYSEAKQMYSTDLSGLGWKNTDMRLTYLPAILALMPTEVQNGIREVSKKASVGGASSTIETVSDKLFLLSEVEIFGSTSYSAAGEGTQYDYYKAGNSKVKNRNGSAAGWWERSPYASASTAFCLVYSNGNANNYYASFASGVAFGFCF